MTEININVEKLVQLIDKNSVPNVRLNQSVKFSFEGKKVNGKVVAGTNNRTQMIEVTANGKRFLCQYLRGEWMGSQI